MVEGPISIEELLQEQQSLSAGVSSLKDVANGLFSMINLKESSDWTPEQVQELDKKQAALNSSFMTLKAGLEKHYADEESVLKLYLGPYLLEAIHKEAGAIGEQIHQFETLLYSTDVKGVNREDSLVKCLTIKQSAEKLSQQIETHNQKIEGVFKLLKSVA
jgi:hypothetical protein